MTTEQLLFRLNPSLKLGPEIGCGAFGSVYEVQHVKYSGKLAVKITTPEKDDKSRCDLLFKEAKALNRLKDELGFPKLKDFRSSPDFAYVVMNLLGPSLESLLRNHGKKFSLKTSLMLALQMLDRIESLHKQNLIHRDLKPDNFAVGSEKRPEMLHLLDLGLAKYYRDSRGSHILPKDRGNLIGNMRFSSVNAQSGLEQSRKDDLYSLGYIVVYMVTGTLPWANVPSQSHEERFQQVLAVKRSTSPAQLCSGLPRQFQTYFEYLDNLPFAEGPSYFYLCRLFSEVMKENKLEFDYLYDWVATIGDTHFLPSNFQRLRDNLEFKVRQAQKSPLISSIEHLTSPKIKLGTKTVSLEAKDKTDFQLKVRRNTSIHLPMSVGQESIQRQFISKLVFLPTPDFGAITASCESTADREDDAEISHEGLDLEKKLSFLSRSDTKPRKLSDLSEHCRTTKTRGSISNSLFS